VAKFRVAITDNTFAPIDLERRLFAEIDADVRRGEDALTEEAVLALADGCDAIVCDAAPITRRVLEALPTVKVVSEYGIGVDNIDVAAATALGVWVANVPGFCAEEVSDHAIAMVLALARRLPQLDRVVRAGAWGARSSGVIHRLNRQTLGVVGFGRIGRSTARKARALGMRVLAHSPRSAALLADEVGAEAVDLDRLLRESDYVCLHAPATAETRGLIDARALDRMKPGAYLVNVGRGSLVDEAALVGALCDGRLAGAALDVFANEPVDPASPLLALENVLLTPHAGFYSEESLEDLQAGAARNVIAALVDGRPNAPVNPEVAGRTR
jgi:D-3-phosphoglycerate dehydrogenase